MNEPPVIPIDRSRKTILFVVGVLAGLVALVSIGVVLFFALGFRVNNQHQSQSKVSKSPFLELSESTIPGRYKWTDGNSEFFMVLYDDHTFMNRDGTTFAVYHWDVTADGLSIRWLQNTTLFTNIEAAGVYMSKKPSGASVRMEKLPPYRPGQLAPPTPIAAIHLGARCETNGLTPVNTKNGEGQIVRGNAGGVECYQLVRNGNQREASFYLQIAPELKETPFTNALVIVEFFDASPPDRPAGKLLIRYDSLRSTNANVQPLRLTGSQTWQEATFFVSAPLFQNRQEGGADFQLCAETPELFVRAVKLVKNVILPEMKMPTSRGL